MGGVRRVGSRVLPRFPRGAFLESLLVVLGFAADSTGFGASGLGGLFGFRAYKGLSGLGFIGFIGLPGL